MDLQSFLIMPMQRICRYPLFFDELMKLTPPEEPQYQKLEEAAKQLKQIISIIDEKTRQVTILQDLLEVLQKLDLSGHPGFEIVDRNRSFICEGDFPLNKSKNGIYAFLFSDVLMTCTKRKAPAPNKPDLYQVKYILHRDDIVMIPSGEDDPQDTVFPLKFAVLGDKPWTVEFTSRAEKLKWEKNLSNYTEKKNDPRGKTEKSRTPSVKSRLRRTTSASGHGQLLRMASKVIETNPSESSSNLASSTGSSSDESSSSNSSSSSSDKPSTPRNGTVSPRGTTQKSETSSSGPETPTSSSSSSSTSSSSPQIPLLDARKSRGFANSILHFISPRSSDAPSTGSPGPAGRPGQGLEGAETPLRLDMAQVSSSTSTPTSPLASPLPSPSQPKTLEEALEVLAKEKKLRQQSEKRIEELEDQLRQLRKKYKKQKRESQRAKRESMEKQAPEGDA